jgi:UDP-N-acetylmuramoylalanine--D-glutamate ligase
LKNFEAGVLLILGGRDKGLDFGILRKHEKRIRKLVCYGQDGERIRDSLGLAESYYTYRFEDAVKKAVQQSVAGDTILLSPGCTSWDQFANYEVRGDVFRDLIVKYFEEA